MWPLQELTVHVPSTFSRIFETVLAFAGLSTITRFIEDAEDDASWRLQPKGNNNNNERSSSNERAAWPHKRPAAPLARIATTLQAQTPKKKLLH